MPNWNFNEVEIDVSTEHVRKYLVEKDGNTYFNMHTLFPKHFPEWDEVGTDSWNWVWMEQNTHSRSLPEVDILPASNENKTMLSYETAWTPNNWTLLQLSKCAWVKITNTYEEPNEFLCWVFVCEDWLVLLDEEREFLWQCGCCEERFDYDDLVDNDRYSFLCKHCISFLKLKIHCPCCGEEVTQSEMDAKVAYCPECRERFPMNEAVAS